MLQLDKLQCLHLNEKDALGIDMTPYFSWRLVSDDHDVMQESYRLTVQNERGECVWDSGAVSSDQSTFVPYEGAALTSGTGYIWKTEVTDNLGHRASGSARFETALLNEGDWSAQWVKSPLPVCKRQAHLGEQPPAVLFRKEFTLHSRVQKARLYATCHGVYHLFVNGIRPDNREFAPECTVYRDYLCYQAYDVTSLLQEGDNVIGMHVGDGWYHGYMTKAQDDSYDPAPAILLQLEVTCIDGTKETITSDAQVKVHESPVRCSDLFAGERYDANRRVPDWNLAGGSTQDWESAVPADFGYGNLKVQYGAPVRPIRILPVRAVLTSPKGERIFDFGQVIAGRLRLTIDVPKGTVVTITHTESLDKDGNYFDNNPTADQRIEYISSGEAEEYEPHFTFQGFRYVMIDGIDVIDPADVRAVVLSSEKDNAGSFACSDPDINRLYLNTRWSQYANMLSLPTDCPQREKAGWTGDIQVYTKTAIQNEDMTAFLTRWLSNLAIEQKDNGSVPFVVPLAGAYIGQYQMYEQMYQMPGALGTAGWSDAAVLIPWYMYQLTGNVVIVRQQYDSMKKWCDYVIRTARDYRPQDSTLPDEIEQYLWDYGHHYGEHMIPSYSKDGYGEKTFEAIRVSTRYVAPIYAYLSISCMAGAAELLGRSEDQAYYTDMAQHMKEAFGEGVIDREGNMPADLMGAYAMPLYYGLVPEKWKEPFAQRLVASLEANEGCLDTGFLATPILQDALCGIGRRDLAYDLLFNRKSPSWLYEVDHGATSIWESWFALDENGAPYVSEMMGMTFSMSLNHYAFGCVDDWMFRTINGINPASPGFREILIQPQPDARLTWAKRTFISEYGPITSDWTCENAEFSLKVEIPCNTHARIILPDGSEHTCGSGRYEFHCGISGRGSL